MTLGVSAKKLLKGSYVYGTDKLLGLDLGLNQPIDGFAQMGS